MLRWVAYKAGVLREFEENGIVYVSEPRIEIVHEEGLDQWGKQNKASILS